MYIHAYVVCTSKHRAGLFEVLDSRFFFDVERVERRLASGAREARIIEFGARNDQAIVPGNHETSASIPYYSRAESFAQAPPHESYSDIVAIEERTVVLERPS